MNIGDRVQTIDTLCPISGTIVDASVDYQDSEILKEWEDLFNVHTVLEETKDKYEQKLAKAQAKQPNMEW